MQAVMKDPGYEALSDLDKLHMLEYKQYEAPLPLANKDLHLDVVYNSQLYIKYELLQQAMAAALAALEAGVTAYAYAEISEAPS